MVDPRGLVSLLPGRRWFGQSGRVITGVDVLDEGTVDDGPPALVLALARVSFADGGRAIYHLPLLVDPDGAVRDATEDPERLRILGELMAHAHSVKGDHGAFEFSGGGLDPGAPPGTSVRAVTAEQSNSSLVMDEKVIIKLYRRLEDGPNPDLELSRLLTNEGFEHIPGQVGEACYRGEIDGRDFAVDLALAQRFIPNARDGWEETVATLRRLYDEVDDADAREDIPWLIEQRAGDLAKVVCELAETTAEMHVVLAREGSDPDIAPETVTPEDLDAWAGGALATLQRAARLHIDDATVPFGAVEDRIDRIRSIAPSGMKLRLHGDYHLGQTLLTQRGPMVTDFEGEPARSLAERRAKGSPLRDVAGMLRSFSYAATAAMFDRARPNSPEWARLEPWADAWETTARQDFVGTYLSRCHEGGFLPDDAAAVDTLLDVFELEKALYELAYEHRHRPGWVRIPLKGIEKALKRGSPRG